jgi:hypothetical protein
MEGTFLRDCPMFEPAMSRDIRDKDFGVSASGERAESQKSLRLRRARKINDFADSS